jgi:hypothetical protein
MAAPAVVRRDCDRRGGSGDGPPRVDGDERLVAEPDDDRVGAEWFGGSDPGEQ